MDKKKKVIELLKKFGNETDLFKAFITSDEFENLAQELVKLFAIPDVVERSEQFGCVHPNKYHANDGTSFWCPDCKQFVS